MFFHYLKITFRNILRQKGYYFINVTGLAIGIAAGILILLYVFHEMSYDKFHEKSDRTYRLAVDALIGNTEIQQTYTPAPMPRALYNEFPEIEHITRTTHYWDNEVSYSDKIFVENRVCAVDSTFFKIFTFNFLQGDPEGCLDDPNEVVITKEIAVKYFQDKNPIGKVLTFNDERQFKVTAVVEGLPSNSHMHPEIMTSLVSYDGFYNSEAWFNNNFLTYITLKENASVESLEEKFPDFVRKYMLDESVVENWGTSGNYWRYYFQPLTEIHLTSDISGEWEANGNKENVYIFLAVALFILLIACVNFMNLTTARSANRAKEVGIRKVIGSTRSKLINQFLGESMITSFMALILAAIMVELALPSYNRLVGKSLDLNYLADWWMLPILFGLAIIVGLISGSYPAFYLSHFRPATVLKGTLRKGSGNKMLRSILVIFQLVISVSLIIATIVMYRQLVLLQDKNLGFDKENVLVIRNPQSLGQSTGPFINELKQNPAIEEVSLSHRVPGVRFNNIGFSAEEIEESFTMNLCVVDTEFDDVMKLDMAEGRFFSRDFGTDTTAMVINEAALELLGWEDPVGKKVYDMSEQVNTFHVIGVVENLRYESMHMKVRPMAFILLEGLYGWDYEYLSIRYAMGKAVETITYVEDTWSSFSPQLPMDHTFLDKVYNSLYNNEMQARTVLMVFAGLAIFIACLGLLGLASFMAEQRRKEIGVRKVFGASIENIYSLLSKEFIKWVAIANIIAWPLSWWALDNWLNNYTYRVSLSWWIFLLAGLLTLAVTLLITSYQGYRAANTDPVNALRYE